MQPGSISIQLLDREIEVLNRINHAHLIKLIEVFETQKVRVLNVLYNYNNNNYTKYNIIILVTSMLCIVSHR